MSTLTGWRGRILKVDLETGTIRVIRPDPTVYKKCIGGRGLAGYFLYPEVTRDWTDPRMPLIFMTGPLVDTISPTPGRMTIMSRSPLTGTICDASVGGSFGVQLKRAGWDGILVTGAHHALCGIEIQDERVSIENATDLQGASPDQVIRAKEKSGGSVAAIGKAAENGVRFAGIVVDRHYFAGRGGLGRIMALRNLKYIRVRGSGRTPVHDREDLKAARREIFRLTAASPVLQGELGIRAFGTAALYDLIHQRRMMPTANFRHTCFPSAPDMNAPAFHRRFSPGSYGCSGCHIQCKKRAKDGRSLPEFESLSHFSALVENRDMETVMAANQVCNDSGMDTIEAASTLACHYEFTGTRPEAGDMVSLLEEIAAGRHPDLAEGALRYATSVGHPELAMVVKGQSLPAYDPRGVYGMALAYAVSTRGGCHLRAYPISHEILRKPVATNRFTFSGKARMVKLAEDQNAAVDSLTACKFMFFAASLEEFARAFSAVTGVTMTAQDLQSTGETIVMRERCMNTMNGFNADDDDLPERFFTDSGTGGNGIQVPPLDRNEFLDCRSKYYRIRGLNRNGQPDSDHPSWEEEHD